MSRLLILILTLALFQPVKAAYLLIPMDEKQKDHLKAYGITYWVIEKGGEAQWLLNYRDGSFLLKYDKSYENECIIRGVTFETLPDARAAAILEEISAPDVNMDAIKLEKPPKIAVYSPPDKQPWDDAVTLVLKYAEIPYRVLYDEKYYKILSFVTIGFIYITKILQDSTADSGFNLILLHGIKYK